MASYHTVDKDLEMNMISEAEGFSGFSVVGFESFSDEEDLVWTFFERFSIL